MYNLGDMSQETVDMPPRLPVGVPLQRGVGVPLKLEVATLPTMLLNHQVN